MTDTYDTTVPRRRTALRLPRVDWLGQATGSELGLVYAARYPRRAGRIVLDTTVDPYRTAGAITAGDRPVEDGADVAAGERAGVGGGAPGGEVGEGGLL